MLDLQDYPAAAPQAVAVHLLLELVAGHHAGNTAAMFAAGMGCVVYETTTPLAKCSTCNRISRCSLLSAAQCMTSL